MNNDEQWEAMGEAWAVTDADGARHEVEVEDMGREWRATLLNGEHEGAHARAPGSAHAAVMRLAWVCGWSVVEVVAPGKVSAAQLRVVAQAAATLVLWHDANTPDGDLNGADGHLWTMIDALRAAGYEMPTGTPTGPRREEMAREIDTLRAGLAVARAALRNYVPRCGACRSVPVSVFPPASASLRNSREVILTS